MDKKLILDIKNLEYKSKKSETKTTFEDLKKNLSLLPNILEMFQSINIEKLIIKDNEFTILLNDEVLYLDNKFINISSKLDTSSSQVTFDLYSLYFKDTKIMFDGKVKIDYFKEEINYYGKAYYGDIRTNMTLDIDKKLLKFYLNSETFESLIFLKKYLKLPTIAEQWMYENVNGDFKLQEFYGEFDLINKKIVVDSLAGKAQISNAKIRFHKDIDQIDAQSIDVSFKNSNLKLDLIKPVFKDKKLDGSYVLIRDIASIENGEVEVAIKTESKLDKDVLDILNAYKIKLPLLQKSGNTKADLLMIFPYLTSKKITTKGGFLVSDADIFIKDFSFFSKNAKVILDNSKVKIIDADFKHKNMIDANINLDIDIKTLKSKGVASIKSFLINQNEKDEVVHIKNIKTPISLDFANETNIKIEDLDLKIKIADMVYVDIENLSKIYDYSKLLKDISIKDGNISLIIKNEKNISFNANIKGLDFPIEKDSKQIKNLDIKGLIENNNITVSSLDENIKIKIEDDLKIFLKNLDVIINSKTKESKTLKDMNIFLDNSRIKVDKDIYEIKEAKVSIKDEQISFEALAVNLDLALKKENKAVEELNIRGKYNKNSLELSTINNDLKLSLKNNSMFLNIDGYDIFYTFTKEENVEKEKKEEQKLNFNLQGKNSNIILNDKYKVLADNFEIMLTKDDKYIHIKHGKSDITIKESKDKKVDIFSNDISPLFVNTLLDKEIFKNGNILFLASGSFDNLNGKIIVENSSIKDLALLNNLLIFIHTSPALINPLLAIPSVVGMATNSGFNLAAYRIVNGVVEFNYNKEKELINIEKLVTVGNGIDFDGKGKINLKDMSINSDIKLIFLKDYSKIVGAIPVVNYVLMGDNNRVETEVNLFGDINNPKITTNLTKEAFSIPVNIAKRIINSPSALFNFITGKKSDKNKEENSEENGDEENKNKKENIINKPLE